MKKSILQSIKTTSSVPFRRAALFIFAGILIPIIASLFHLEMTKIFFSIPNISGWDGAAHEALMNVFAKTHYPSTWGWINNWHGGMPFPLLYPPLMYLIGSFFTTIIGSSLVAYKFFSAMILICLSISIFVSLIYFYKKDYPQLLAYKKSDWKLYAALGAGISIILAINTGSPGPKSIYLNSMIGQNLSMIFILPALFSLTSRSRFFAVIGTISWTLIYISSIHTALSGVALSFFILIFQKPKDIWFFFKRFIFIHGLGILSASFWILPMLGSYTYFSGSIQPTTSDILILLNDVWPHFFIALTGIYIAFHKKKDKNSDVLRWSLALITTIVFTGLLYTAQQLFNIFIPLPIYFHRWFETYFFLLCIPYVYALIHLTTLVRYLKTGSGFNVKKREVSGGLLLILLFIFSILPYLVTPKKSNQIYQNYSDGNISSLAETLSKEKGLTLVQSHWVFGRESAPDTLDAEIGKRGGQSTYSNLRESSINGSFLRMVRNSLSFNAENWSLINFYNPNREEKINPNNRIDLLRHLGINNIVFFDEETGSKTIEFAKPTPYTLSTSTPGYTVATIKDPAPFTSLVEGDIALYIGKNGYRERKITDLNYTRFEETSFENNFQRNFFTVNVGVVPKDELLRLYRNSIFTVITDYSMYTEKDIEELISTAIKNYPTHPHTVFLYDDGSEILINLREKYIRSSRVVFFKAKSPSFPYDTIIRKIKGIAKNKVQEIPLNVTSRSNEVISFDIPSVLNPVSLAATTLLKSKVATTTYIKTTLNTTEVRWIFMRQSYHPGWVPVLRGVVQTNYPSSPAYTIIAIDNKDLLSTSTVTVTFPPSYLFIVGHYVTFAVFFTLLGYSVYQTSSSLGERRKKIKSKSEQYIN